MIRVAVGDAIDLKKQKTAKHNAKVKFAVKRQELTTLNSAKQQVNDFVESICSASQPVLHSFYMNVRLKNCSKFKNMLLAFRNMCSII